MADLKLSYLKKRDTILLIWYHKVEERYQCSRNDKDQSEYFKETFSADVFYAVHKHLTVEDTNRVTTLIRNIISQGFIFMLNKFHPLSQVCSEKKSECINCLVNCNLPSPLQGTLTLNSLLKICPKWMLHPFHRKSKLRSNNSQGQDLWMMFNYRQKIHFSLL